MSGYEADVTPITGWQCQGCGRWYECMTCALHCGERHVEESRAEMDSKLKRIRARWRAVCGG